MFDKRNTYEKYDKEKVKTNQLNIQIKKKTNLDHLENYTDYFVCGLLFYLILLYITCAITH